MIKRSWRQLFQSLWATYQSWHTGQPTAQVRDYQQAEIAKLGMHRYDESMLAQEQRFPGIVKIVVDDESSKQQLIAASFYVHGMSIDLDYLPVNTLAHLWIDPNLIEVLNSVKEKAAWEPAMTWCYKVGSTIPDWVSNELWDHLDYVVVDDRLKIWTNSKHSRVLKLLDPGMWVVKRDTYVYVYTDATWQRLKNLYSK
jgi:hypothetical protein